MASLGILFHLIAVFTAPWYLQLYTKVVPMVEPGGAPRDQYGRVVPAEQVTPATFPHQTPVLVHFFAKNLRHYANLLFINHGYEFFSPDPSVSHLLRYEVLDDAGQKVASGQFPNRKEQWPRLFYHRHMMLVEQMLEPGADEARVRERINLVGDRLNQYYNGAAVRLQLLRHHLLAPSQVQSGQRIDADNTYEVLDTIERRRQAPLDAAITAGEAR